MTLIAVVGCVLLGGCGWRLLRRGSTRGTRSASIPDADIAAALEAISRSLRTGSSLRTALRETPLPLSASLAEGHPLPVALDGWAHRAVAPSERLAATALALAAATGGPQAQAVDAAARAVRERIAASAEVTAHSAQARLSGLVIACLPAVFLAWTLLADHRTAAVLLQTPIGWLCIGVGLGLDLAGWLWIRAAVRSTA